MFADLITTCDKTHEQGRLSGAMLITVRRTKSKQEKRISEKSRAEDERLRREPGHTDREQFQRFGQCSFPFAKDRP